MTENKLSGIPGLIGITTEDLEGGGARIIFEVDDKMTDEFFAALGLPSDDPAALEDFIINALEWALKEREKNEPRA